MQQIVLKGGILSAMNICRLSPRQSDFSAIRAGRSLHEELQRRQHQQMSFGSMTSLASHLLNAELQLQQLQQQQQEMLSRECHGSNRIRLGKSSKTRRLIENPLQVLRSGSVARDQRSSGTSRHRLSRLNGKLLDLIDDDDDDIELKDDADYGQWPDQLTAREPPRGCPYCSGDEGHVAKRPSVPKRSVHSSDGNSDGDGDGNGVGDEETVQLTSCK